MIIEKRKTRKISEERAETEEKHIRTRNHTGCKWKTAREKVNVKPRKSKQTRTGSTPEK